MGGLTTPALTLLTTGAPVQTLIGRATGLRNERRQAEDLLGITKSRRRKQERAILDAEQAAESADLAVRQETGLTDLQTRNAGSAERIRVETEIAERNRRRSLRQEAGSIRARLGAQGIGSADGSGEAALLGRERAAAEEREDDARLDALKLAGLSEDEAALKRRNLLDLTRQQERQRLERLARGL